MQSKHSRIPFLFFFLFLVSFCLFELEYEFVLVWNLS